jgi:hypothetical protein
MSLQALKATFWERGGPIVREGLYQEQRESLAQILQLKRDGNEEAVGEIESILNSATKTLLSTAEFSRHHGYQRQQVAAEIVGLVGDAGFVPILEEARQLQDVHAGCSQYSNQTSSKPLVQSAIDGAIRKLQSAAT